MRFCEMLLCALFPAGRLFTQASSGLTAHLAPLLSQHGYQQVQTREYALLFRAGAPEGLTYAEDGVHVFRTLRPFLQKQGPHEQRLRGHPPANDQRDPSTRFFCNLAVTHGLGVSSPYQNHSSQNKESPLNEAGGFWFLLFYWIDSSFFTSSTFAKTWHAFLLFPRDAQRDVPLKGSGSRSLFVASMASGWRFSQVVNQQWEKRGRFCDKETHDPRPPDPRERDMALR